MRTTKQGKPKPRRSAREWSALAKRWQRSKLSIEDFCKDEDVYVETFKWWIWRLKRESEKKKKTKRGVQRSRSKEPRTGLVRVEVGRSTSNMDEKEGGGGWTLKTARGLVLEVQGPVDKSGLRLVLEVLERKGGLR